jgi:exosortase A-associated hydrolase 1
MGDSGGSMRNFDEVDGDIRAAIDAFFDASPGLRNVTIFGLCDAASAALIYCNLCDSRVTGLILANPWIRTEVGEAQAYVRHYYVQRLLQRSFWAKMLSGHVSIRASLRSLATTLRRSLQGQRGLATAQEGHFTERMLAGFEVFRGRVLLIMSERDLTAREFDNYCGQLPRWRRRIKSPGVQRTELRQADHTFSSADALERASMSAIEWLDRAHLPR